MRCETGDQRLATQDYLLMLEIWSLELYIEELIAQQVNNLYIWRSKSDYRLFHEE